jgi:hypothetical protein
MCLTDTGAPCATPHGSSSDPTPTEDRKPSTFCSYCQKPAALCGNCQICGPNLGQPAITSKQLGAHEETQS